MAKGEILQLDSAMNPSAWISWQDYVTHHFKGNILRTMGDPADFKRGGVSRMTGLRTEVEIYPIVAIKDYIRADYRTPPLTNENLYQRDRNMCGYCGRVFRAVNLSRDHIQPVSKGGPNIWKNCVTSCKKCNHEKGDLTIAQWDKQSQKDGYGERKLLYVPYTPSAYESLILQGRNILASQMDFLVQFLPEHSRLKPS